MVVEKYDAEIQDAENKDVVELLCDKNIVAMFRTFESDQER